MSVHTILKQRETKTGHIICTYKYLKYNDGNCATEQKIGCECQKMGGSNFDLLWGKLKYFRNLDRDWNLQHNY
jgi:hypothetical protein